MIQRLCKNCGITFDNYTSIGRLCPKCYYSKVAKPRKPIKRIGKVTKRWLSVRAQWLRDNPPPWSCYLCGKPLVLGTITLDHVEARSRRPDLRFVEHNLEPCCFECNHKKGSKSLTEL